MKRDMDLIRLVLLHVEGEEDVDLSEYDKNQIKYHKALVLEAGLADGPKPIYSMRGPSTGIPEAVNLRKITKGGREFLDNIRESSIWEEVKKQLHEKGISASFEAINLCAAMVRKAKLT